MQSFTARMPLLMATSRQVTENGAKKVTLRIFQFPCKIYTIYMQIHEKVQKRSKEFMCDLYLKEHECKFIFKYLPLV